MVLLPQLFNHSIILGVDSLFHFNRFYEAAMQIKTHHFSYFQSNFGFQQSGRIVNALYGPYLAYIFGWLLLHLGGWFKFELVIGVLLEFIAGSGMYLLARRTKAARGWACSVALIYMLSGWVPSWLTTQEFMAWGAAIMPWVLIAGVRMVTDHARPVPVMPLAVGMAVLVQTHVLSSVLVTIALVPFAIAGFILSKRRGRMVLDLLLAVLLCAALTANVWGALLEVYTSNHVLAPYMPLNSGTYTTKLSLGSYGRGTLGGSLGIVCSLLFTMQIIYFCVRKHKTVLEGMLTGVGGAFLIAASPLVPWNHIVAKWPVLGSYLQFPSRLASVAAILLLGAVSMSLTELSRRVQQGQSGTTNVGWPERLLRVLIGLGIVFLAYQTLTNVESSAESWNKPKVMQSQSSVTLNAVTMDDVRTAFMSKDLGSGLQMAAKGTPDYLPVPTASVRWFKDNNQYELYHKQSVLITTPETAPTGQIGNKIDAKAYKLQGQVINADSPYAIYYEQLIAPNGYFVKTPLQNGGLQLEWLAKKRDIVQLPIVKYNHSLVTINGHRLRKADYERSDIGAITTWQRKGRNIVQIRYQPAQRTQFLLKMTPYIWAATILLAAGLFCWRKRTAWQYAKQN
ncbi:hypothetical protein [Lacticaseibacillus zhaodongensis]|uniref:hypothetical protein n=1 Tax=Lacticaseibacillus zhaodongensis TaxID=2668065 RepID=UPI0012D2C042|nr:hypothetical protein [Lacticaseibacillus zhaodongensis]